MPVCPGSMGKPTPGYEIDIIDEDGAILPDGELGSIAVRTEPRPVGLFINYVDGAEVTAERFRNGWYYPGDRGRLDPNGSLWLDRKSVVWGRSVSLRLDLGGARIFKQKK